MSNSSDQVDSNATGQFGLAFGSRDNGSSRNLNEINGEVASECSTIVNVPAKASFGLMLPQAPDKKEKEKVLKRQSFRIKSKD
mmetsp:Transcript_9267/g.15594  ORF Transcript_9267/g.15594 Transcript_9267/m.15594 type:complete len:83 (+) Transcript_9267:396-644(+)